MSFQCEWSVPVGATEGATKKAAPVRDGPSSFASGLALFEFGCRLAVERFKRFVDDVGEPRHMLKARLGSAGDDI